MKRMCGYGLLFSLLLVLCGCGGKETDAVRTPVVSAEQETAKAQVTQVEIEEEKQEEGYAYSTLKTQEERLLYKEMLETLTGMETNRRLTTCNLRLLEPVFHCVMADHPELFYTDGYTTTTYRLGEELKKIEFSGSYTMDVQTMQARLAAIEAAIAECFGNMPPGLDDYGKAKYLYEYVITHTAYVLDAADGQNICSVFLNGESVCQGYAKAFQYLCQRRGIPSVTISGQVKEDGHAWTLVQLDGDWYHVDPTWGDAAYLLEGEGSQAQTSYPAVNYNYFCVTTREISVTHRPDQEWVLPECTATKNQYYRREGLFLESVDLDQVAGMLEQAMQRGDETLTFQCADDEIYAKIYGLLIEEQKIFDYLPDNRAAYVDSPRQRTLTFWLPLQDVD